MTIHTKPKRAVEEVSTVWRYAVKFVRGCSDGSLLAKGVYVTVITLYNSRAEAVRFRRKLAVSLSADEPDAMLDPPFGSLGPHGTLTIDCANIFKEVDPPQSGVHTGYVILESLAQLNVAAIYTAAGADGYVVGFKIEDVEKRAENNHGCYPIHRRQCWW